MKIRLRITRQGRPRLEEEVMLLPTMLVLNLSLHTGRSNVVEIVVKCSFHVDIQVQVEEERLHNALGHIQLSTI